MGSRRLAEAVAAGAPFPRNWRLASVLGLRLGLCCPNQSPKPSRANSLAFAGAARVVSCKGVNGALIATAASCISRRTGRNQTSVRSFRPEAVGVEQFGQVRDLVRELFLPHLARRVARLDVQI